MMEGYEGYKAAFKGAMNAYGILAYRSVRYIQHVTGTAGDGGPAHYAPEQCQTCREIAAHVAEWSEEEPGEEEPPGVLE